MIDIESLMGPAQFGMMNAFRSGNTTIDFLVCLIIPIVFSTIIAYIRDVPRYSRMVWELLFKNAPKSYHRHIEHVAMQNKYGYCSPSDQHNLVLQKALLLYVTKNCDLSFSGGRFKLVEKPSDKPQGHNPYDNVYDDDYDGSELSQLKAFEIVTEPPLNVPVDVGNGVTINMQNKANDEGEGGEKDKGSQVLKTTITFTVSCEGGDGKQKVDAFVVTAFEWYISYVAAQADTARYMYVMRPKGSSGNSIDDDGIMYKRYELSEDKTFDAMFFRQKAALLRLLSHFKNRMGKYAIRSYPTRLTLLLHGSPGTGKTSLIKALAQHTQRHIISIPLARIATNQELMDVMFDQCYTIKQDDLPMKLKFKQVVFVIEDIDCASKIVFARNSKTDESGSTKSNINETVSTLSDLISSNGPKTKRESMFTSGNDALNLAGLLNVLDGIVDCVDRIVIMTTNHPEKLDPALIRPGRVNLNIHLGFIRDIESFEMIEHFFTCSLSEKEKSVISRALATAVRTFTPAEMEQLCCEYDTVEEMIEALTKSAQVPKVVLSAQNYVQQTGQVIVDSGAEFSDQHSASKSQIGTGDDSETKCISDVSDDQLSENVSDGECLSSDEKH